MSFFDNFQDAGGGNYVAADEKDVLIENGIPFKVTGVVFEEEGKFGDRYVIRIDLPNPENGEEEERLMSFGAGSVESRDRMLRAMMAYLEDADAEPPEVKLEKIGRAVLIRNAAAADEA